MLTYEKIDSTETTLNDIPNGTVFEGEVEMTMGGWSNFRIFLKIANQGQFGTGTPLAVHLTGCEPTPDKPWVGYWDKCVKVRRYRALKNPKIVEG